MGLLPLRLHGHGVLAVEVFWGLWLLGRLITIAGAAYIVHSITSLALGGERIC